MLFETPTLRADERHALDQIRERRAKLRHYVAEPRRWSGSLRRVSFARAIRASNSIEGYHVTLDDALAAVEGNEPLDAADETWDAVRGYRDAMTYVLQVADDPHFSLDVSFIRGLHFMMTHDDLANRPGTWRPGVIYVRDEATGVIVYEGPDADSVPGLVQELTDELAAPDETPPTVRAAMAHLNLVMIHPFRDGNGRMARALQTLVLAREGILAPQFCSIEEYLGRNTRDYYDVLGEVGGGSWQPHRDARPWLRFCLTAHHRQAGTHLQRVRESERLWEELEHTVERAGLNPRCIPALFDAAIGLRLTNADYRSAIEEDVAEQTASRDLRSLVEADLLEPHGERRGRHYTRTAELRDLRERARDASRVKQQPLFADGH